MFRCSFAGRLRRSGSPVGLAGRVRRSGSPVGLAGRVRRSGSPAGFSGRVSRSGSPVGFAGRLRRCDDSERCARVSQELQDVSFRREVPLRPSRVSVQQAVHAPRLPLHPHGEVAGRHPCPEQSSPSPR